MKNLVLKSCRTDPAIRDTVLKTSTGLFSNPVDAVRGAEYAARNAFTLVDEPDELLIDPSLMFQMVECDGRILGDCDDMAMYVACFTYSLGLPTRFKAVQRAPDGSFMHVFAEYYNQATGRWIPVDPTIETIPVYEPGDYITEVL